MKLHVKLGVAGIGLVVLALTACTSSSNTVKVRGQKDPLYHMESSSSPVSARAESTVNLPEHWGGGFYGYPGSASFLTPGQRALVSYPGSAMIVGVPATSASAVTTSNDKPATQGQLKAVGSAVVTVTKQVCAILKTKNRECK